MSYRHTIEKNKAKKFQMASKVVHLGGIDLLIVSPEPGNPEPLYQMLRPEQVSSDAAKVYLKFTKEYKNTDGTGWAWSFDATSHKWHEINDEGIPGCLKLGAWLADPEVIAMLTSGAVRSVTYKATQFGPNITKAQAIANSEAWEEVEFDPVAASASIDDLPEADWNETPATPESSTPASSPPGSSTSHAATPPGRGRGRGAGRGRGRH